jgi:hypothetical protein
MNHNVTLGTVAIVAATALTGVAFGIPQAFWILDNTGSSTVCLNQGDNSADIHR